MQSPHVVILGAGPAGLGAAFQLSRRGSIRVTVLEQHNRVGGNAGSFDLEGMRVDFGSHRLHPVIAPEVLSDIRNLLGEDLLDRPRHGRIRMQGRWIHFPLKFIDLALRLPPGFLLGATADQLRKVFRSKRHSSENISFATILESGLGKTICRDFYFPYARKLWGLPPEELSVRQAQVRVSANSVGKVVRKLITAVPGLKSGSTGRFFYPRHGYGQISEAFCGAAEKNGAEICLRARVRSIDVSENKVRTVQFEKDGTVTTLDVDQVWSTIPVNVLARSIAPSPPEEVCRAAEKIQYRAMILIYLVLEQERFSEYDAHYFPEPTIAISRISEPKNFCDGYGNSELTTICAELPCAQDSPEWNKSDEELGKLVQDCLDHAGIPIRATIRKVVTQRLHNAYPIFHHGYQEHFDRLDQWLNRIEGLVTLGRQGLFVHDNTHHALYMGYSAAKCLEDKGFNREAWQQFRRIFDTHVVED